MDPATLTPTERLELVADLSRQILDILPPGDIPSVFRSGYDGEIDITLHIAGHTLLVEAGATAYQEGGHEHAALTLPSGARLTSCRPIPTPEPTQGEE